MKQPVRDISSVGRAIPCQGIGHQFEPDMSLQILFYIVARWQNGYAADCKSVDLGSTPGRASTKLRLIALMLRLLKQHFARVVESVDTRDLKSLAE